MKAHDMITTGKVQKPFHALLYGPPKIGKTHLALQAQAPLVIDADDGSGQFDAARISNVTSLDILMDALRCAYKSDEHKTVILDSVTAIDRIISDSVCKNNGWANLEALDYGKCHAHVYSEWKKVLDIVEQLKAKGKNIIWIGHQKVTTVRDPMLDVYEKLDLEVSKGVLKELISRTDAILYYRWKINVTKDDKTKRVRGLSNGTRQIFTKENASFVAGNRYNLPFMIENPNNVTLWELMK
jgi:AAA domain